MFRSINVISILLGVLGLGWGVYTFYASKQFPSISYVKETKRVFQDRSGKFKLMHSDGTGGELTGSLSVTRIVFWNSGSIPISALDLRRPFQVSAASGSKIVDPTVSQSYPDLAEFSLATNGDSVQLRWKYFDPGFGGVVDLYHTGIDTDPIITTSYVGDRAIVHEQPRWTPIYVFIPMWVLVGILAFVGGRYSERIMNRIGVPERRRTIGHAVILLFLISVVALPYYYFHSDIESVCRYVFGIQISDFAVAAMKRFDEVNPSF